MQEFWKTIDQNFWEFEKMIRAIIEQDTTKKNRDNLQNIGELMRKMKPKDKQVLFISSLLDKIIFDLINFIFGYF